MGIKKEKMKKKRDMRRGIGRKLVGWEVGSLEKVEGRKV